MIFPKIYSKPVLMSIMSAEENGWNAVCGGGIGPGTGGITCNEGSSAGAGGKSGSDGRLYTNPDNSSRLLNPEDVNSGGY